MKFGSKVLYKLITRTLSIEEVAKTKERGIGTTRDTLRALKFEIIDFRLWQNYRKERRRLIYLRDFGMYSTPEMEERIKEISN